MFPGKINKRRVAGHSNVEGGMRNGECWHREHMAKHIAGGLSGCELRVPGIYS